MAVSGGADRGWREPGRRKGREEKVASRFKRR